MDEVAHGEMDSTFWLCVYLVTSMQKIYTFQVQDFLSLIELNFNVLFDLGYLYTDVLQMSYSGRNHYTPADLIHHIL
jgi:hypothetical protein